MPSGQGKGAPTNQAYQSRDTISAAPGTKLKAATAGSLHAQRCAHAAALASQQFWLLFLHN